MCTYALLNLAVWLSVHEPRAVEELRHQVRRYATVREDAGRQSTSTARPMGPVQRMAGLMRVCALRARRQMLSGTQPPPRAPRPLCRGAAWLRALLMHAPPMCTRAPSTLHAGAACLLQARKQTAPAGLRACCAARPRPPALM